VHATIAHNGYGYFIANELGSWGSDRGSYGIEQRIAIRRALRSGTRDEIADKQAIRIGGERENEYFSSGEDDPWVPEDMGMAIASLDRADIRQSKFGIFIHDDDGKRDIDVMSGYQLGVPQRRAELEELYHAIYCGKPLWHNGRWGMATLEACLAMIESSRSRREVTLRHQVPVAKAYDDDVDFFSESFAQASDSRAAQRDKPLRGR
jgi:phthalate 4,5-cis-dihydrodiol dehydrogenase